MKTNNKLNVLFNGKVVGMLALAENKQVAFEYSDEWIKDGFSISPFSLPLKRGVFLPSKPYFNGLFGVFADSLPDAWGNLLLDRFLKEKGINVDQINMLDRLAIVGSSGMGALSYEPEIEISSEEKISDLDELAGQCMQILTTSYSEDLDELYRLGGTSGGARPKILTVIDGEDWIIKFPSHLDMKDSGEMEYEYSKCAGQCEIKMPPTRIFASRNCQGFFGIKRFDRSSKTSSQLLPKIHMCTVAALLETDFNSPSLDYNDLMKLTKIITKNNLEDVEQMYRRMCFNVFAHNRDDHAKNFTFIYNEEEKGWKLSPAYDLTYSTTFYGEHTTSVNGNGRNPELTELIAVGRNAGISSKKCKTIAESIEICVKEQIEKYIAPKLTKM